MKSYTVRRVPAVPLERVDFERAETGRVACVRPESGAHVPETFFSVVHDACGLSVCFTVHDRYVRSVQTAFQAPVYTDSCVEFFVQPRPDKGYFNFEVNAGGALLLYYIEDPTRDAQKGFVRHTPVSEEWCGRVQIRSSLPAVVEPEIAEAVTWRVRYRIPFELFEAFVGGLRPLRSPWRGNFFKCGDRTSHPHWLSWSPVPVLNFHMPECFGELVLE